MEIDGLFSTLLTATFAGLPFGVLNVDLEEGRRSLQFVFPGVDVKTYQDLGADDGPMTVRGILCGDDYIAQMQTWRQTCRNVPGPYTLVHPWLGTLQVVFAPNSRVKFSLVATELRVARFEMVVMAYNPQPPAAGLDTLSQLEVQCDEASAAAQQYIASALAPISSVLGALSYAQGYLSGLGTTVAAAIASFPSAAVIGGVAAAQLAGLTVVTSAVASLWAGNTAAAMVAVPAAIEGACAPLVPAAVAPGGSTTAAAAADPAQTCATLLACAAGAVVPAGTPAPGPGMAAGMQAAFVVAAVLAASRINYTSQQQAEAQAALLYAALDAATVAVGTLAATDPANAAPVWRGLVQCKAALAADTNALIGRLPPVVTITIASAVPAWILAQYISGDEPAQVYATYQDLIARNAVLNPAFMGPGALEVLDT